MTKIFLKMVVNRFKYFKLIAETLLKHYYKYGGYKFVPLDYLN